jgi:hypothetical protein
MIGMSVEMMIALGLACGLVASVPMAWSMGRSLAKAPESLSVGRGLRYVAITFVTLSALIGVVYVVAPEGLAAFGGAMGAAFAVTWLVFGIRSALLPSRQGL